MWGQEGAPASGAFLTKRGLPGTETGRPVQLLQLAFLTAD